MPSGVYNRNKFWYNKEWINHQWFELDKTVKEICAEFNISIPSFRSAAIKFNLKKPTQTKPPNVKCDYCGKLYKEKPWRIRRAKNHFCSREHKKIYRKENRNEKRFYGDNWKQLQRETLIRDNFKCAKCGRDKGVLHVHHKIQIKCFENKEDANYLDNLITYCSRCHKQAEFLTDHLDFSCGKGTVIPKPWLVNIYGGKDTKIGENCLIAPFVEIQTGVKIGNNCRIQSHAFICSGVTIEDNTFISHGVMFINDRFPPRGKEFWEDTLVNKYVMIGSNATIMPCVIGEYARIGAGSVVTKNIQCYKVVKGNPAK